MALDCVLERAALTRARLDRCSTQPQPPHLAIGGDLVHLPCGDATFDTVVAIGVIPVGGSADIMGQIHAEIARVLKPGGTLLAKLTSSAEAFQESELLAERAPRAPHDERHALGNFAEAWFSKCRGWGLLSSCPAEFRSGGCDNSRLTVVGIFQKCLR